VIGHIKEKKMSSMMSTFSIFSTIAVLSAYSAATVAKTPSDYANENGEAVQTVAIYDLVSNGRFVQGRFVQGRFVQGTRPQGRATESTDRESSRGFDDNAVTIKMISIPAAN
jgi:hypothetical protein